MKKGFTLLELIVVIIILGVLATLAVVQYQRVIEKSRGAEARMVLGAIRSNCAAIYMRDNNDAANCGTAANVGIGNDYPATCAQTTHYFSYGIAVATNTATITATRCTASGKAGGAGIPPAGTVTLTSAYATGVDTWVTAGAQQ